MSDEDRVAAAEAAAEAELPDAPVWEGMVFEGFIVDDVEVCVDRTWGPNGGPGDIVGSAGYVVVQFPSEEIGEPETGVCSDYAPMDDVEPVAVEVPADVADERGLLVRTDFGDAWPFTVDYVVGGCTSITVNGEYIEMVTVTAPDGTSYAVNGTALDHGNGDYANIDPIWAPDPDVDGLKISMQPIMDKVSGRC